MATYGGSVPKLGARVTTSDGVELGKVKEINGECFLIDAPLQPDYWLPTDTIDSTLVGEVLLSFSKNGLTKEKADAEAHRGVHRHT